MVLANLIIAGVYYVLAVIITFFSLFGVYVLLRYGQSRAFSLVVTVIYSVLFLIILERSHLLLSNIIK